MHPLGPDILAAIKAQHAAPSERRVFRCVDCLREMTENVDSCPECRRMSPDEIREANMRRDPKYWAEAYKAISADKRHVDQVDRKPHLFSDDPEYQRQKAKLYPDRKQSEALTVPSRRK